MSWNTLIRQSHRWVSVVFTSTVIANIVVIVQGNTPPSWVTYAPLLPLALLQLSGMYLFALPYFARWRSGR